MDQDRHVFDWLRRYAVLVLTLVFVGGAGGLLYGISVPHKAEAWTIVVEKGFRIQPRQLGPVAQAVFSSNRVYAPVMTALNVTGSARRFLSDQVELRPVPDTNTLIVVGKAPSLDRAKSLSNGMARSLIDAFNGETGPKQFYILSAAQAAPIAVAASASTIAAFAAFAGLWLGLGIAALHYRFRRPVLSLRRAMAIASADRVLILDAARRRPFHSPSRIRWRQDDDNAAALRRFVLEHGDADVPDPVVPGAGRAAQSSVLLRWWDTLGRDGSEARAAWDVLVCNASTSEFDIFEASRSMDHGGRGIDLVWVR